MMNLWRQEDIINSDELNASPLVVIGAGGIGSPTVLALTKMGVKNVTVYDPDTIEDHNLPNQIYRTKDIGTSKVVALQDICKEFSGVEIETNENIFTDKAKGIVISGVDSMKSRKDIWELVKYDPSVKVYIEARMGAEVARIHTVNVCDPDHVEWYETTLYSDDVASEAPCTERAIIYNVFMIASLIASQAKKYIKGQKYPKEIIFDIRNLLLMTKD